MFAWVCPRWVTAQAEGALGPLALALDLQLGCSGSFPTASPGAWGGMGAASGESLPSCNLPLALFIPSSLRAGGGWEAGKQGSREGIHPGRTGPEERGGELGQHAGPCLQMLRGGKHGGVSLWTGFWKCLPSQGAP